MGKRLPSGAGVLFRIPSKNNLEQLAQAQSKSGASNVRFLPVVYWLDDADDASVIVSYVSEAYYEQPSPRLRIHSFSVRHLPKRVDSSRREDAGPIAKFHGVYADVVPRSEWEEVPEVTPILSGITEPQVLSKEDSKKIFESIPQCGASDYRVPLPDGVLGFRKQSEKCAAATAGYALSGGVRPFRPALTNPEWSFVSRDFAALWTLRLINGRSFQWRGGRWHFDPTK